MVENLSSLLRYPLADMENEFVPIKNEIEFIQNYLEVERIRFGKRLEFEIIFDENLEKALLPPMIIQPFVENSIIHGISKLKDGGNIQISCKKENNRCTILIKDDGVGFKDQLAVGGFGIRSVRERLNLIYKNDHQFEITDNQGTLVNINIPLKNEL